MSVKWEPNGVYFSNNSNSLYKTTSENFTPPANHDYRTTVTTYYDIGMMVLRTYNCTTNYKDYYAYFQVGFSYGKWVIAIRWPYWSEYEDEDTGETVLDYGYQITGNYPPGTAWGISSPGESYVYFKTDMPFRVFAWRIE